MGAPGNGFTAEYGTAQGRIQPTHWTAPSGEFVFQLGHDRPGVLRTLELGEVHRIEQSFDVTADASYLRAILHVRPPTVPMPENDWFWIVHVTAGALTYEFVIATGARERTRYDIAIPLKDARETTIDVFFELLLYGTTVSFGLVELPGLYVDAVVIDRVPVGPLLIDRDPEPNDTGVPADTAITLTYTDPSGAGISSSSTYLNGVLVVTLDGLDPTFTAPGWVLQSIVTLDDSSYALTLIPPAPFASLEVVTVRAVASIPALPLFDTSYSFTIADTTAPVVLDAFAPTEITVRVRFDEPVKQLGPAVAGDALNPTSYAIALVDGAPAVTPVVVAVTSDSASSVVLTLDRIMTRGATYSVTVTGVVDLFDNEIVAPGNVATFTGYEWPALPGRRTKLFEMLPEDIQRRDETGDHRRFIGVMQELLDVYYGIADRALDIIDVDFAPEPWVDLMLVDLGNPFDFLELTDVEKRILAKTLIAIYRKKGTGPGIVSTIRFFLGIEVTLRVFAWSPYPIGVAIIGQTFILGSAVQSDLYTFEVVVTEFLTATQRKHLSAIVEYMKVAHEHWRLVEPVVPVIIDHWQIGFSRLGIETTLH